MLVAEQGGAQGYLQTLIELLAGVIAEAGESGGAHHAHGGDHVGTLAAVEAQVQRVAVIEEAHVQAAVPVVGAFPS